MLAMQGLQAEHFPLQHELGGDAVHPQPLQGDSTQAGAATAAEAAGPQTQEQRDGNAQPAGGRIAARIRVKHLATPDKTPDLSVVITGASLHCQNDVKWHDNSLDPAFCPAPAACQNRSLLLSQPAHRAMLATANAQHRKHLLQSP